jgi:hypothetical protein
MHPVGEEMVDEPFHAGPFVGKLPLEVLKVVLLLGKQIR